jgi:hypothetical protein
MRDYGLYFQNSHKSISSSEKKIGELCYSNASSKEGPGVQNFGICHTIFHRRKKLNEYTFENLRISLLNSLASVAILQSRSIEKKGNTDSSLANRCEAPTHRYGLAPMM